MPHPPEVNIGFLSILKVSDFDTIMINMSSSSQLTATLYLNALKELLKKRGVTTAILPNRFTVRCQPSSAP